MKKPIETLFIGTKFLGHDSAFFIVDPANQDIFALSTEKLTRYKHDTLSPEDVLEKYLEYSDIDTKSVKRIVIGSSFNSMGLSLAKDYYYFHNNFRFHFDVFFKKDVNRKWAEFESESPLKKSFQLVTSLNGINLIALFIHNKIFGQKRISLENKLKEIFGKHFKNADIEVEFHDHETAHAISSHYTSPFPKELLYAADGLGDGDFSKVFIADRDSIKQIATSPCRKVNLGTKEEPHNVISSVGKIYSYFTGLLGFEEEADEGKVEALAAYGVPVPELLSNLVSIFTINAENGLEADAVRMQELLNKERILVLLATSKKEDVAASVQKFLETITEKYLLHLKEVENFDSIALSGGVAANVINNLMIFEKITKRIHIIPAFGDDGSAQGAALMSMISHGYTYDSLTWLRKIVMPYFGTSYTADEVEETLSENKNAISYEYMGSEWPEKVGELIAKGEIGSIFHGKMEWGPRALGNRSIVADPRRPDFRDKINKEIKRRPYFQPFCPSILEEERTRLFEDSYENKHMTCAFRMKKTFYDTLPSAIHIDGTARAQFVREADNPNYFRLLKKVKQFTGFGIVINTSFNKHGRTIVESPEDAVTDFIDTDMDFLAIEGYLVRRKK